MIWSMKYCILNNDLATLWILSCFLFINLCRTKFYKDYVTLPLQKQHAPTNVGKCCLNGMFLQKAIKEIFALFYLPFIQRICLNRRSDWLAKISIFHLLHSVIHNLVFALMCKMWAEIRKCWKILVFSYENIMHFLVIIKDI